MAAPFRPIAVEGVRELNRLLKLAGGPELQKQLGRANKFIGGQVVARARPAAPYLDGDLRDSTRASASSRMVQVKAGGRRAPHAPLIHWGSRYRPSNPPRPWIAETATEMEGQITAQYFSAIEHVIRVASAE